MRKQPFHKRLPVVLADIVNGYRIVINDFFKPFWRKVILAVMTTVLLFGGGMGIMHNQYQGMSRKVSAAGTTYYVDATSGNDSNNGRSTALAWKTIFKVNGSTFLPGDSILFKRGEVWDTLSPAGLQPPSDGSSGAPITFGAYGNGVLPIITALNLVPGSSTASNWTDYGAVVANTWYMPLASSPYRIGINGVESWPPPSDTAAGVNATYRWWWGNIGGTNCLLVYSGTGNPATAGLNLVQSRANNPLIIKGRQNLIIDSLEFQGGYSAINIDSTQAANRNIIIQNCKAGYRSLLGINEHGGSTGSQSDHITIHDCDINSGAPSTSAGVQPKYVSDGVNVRSVDYLTMYNNTLTDWGHSSIYLYSEATAVDATSGFVRYADIYNNTITGPHNYLRGFNSDGAFDGQCAYNNFHNNSIINTTVVNQINGDHNTFANNLIDGIVQPAWLTNRSVATGISLGGYAGPSNNNIISGNIIKNCGGPGINLSGTTGYGNKYGNIISGNTIFNCGTDTRFTPLFTVGLKINGDATVLANTYTNNIIGAPVSSNTVYYRGTYLGATDFNALNGANGDIISGNNPTVSGDINGDNHVTITDLSILASHWGSSGVTLSQGDLNNDRQVNISDLSILAAHWGT